MFLQVFVKIIPDVKVPDMQYPFKSEEFQDDISPDTYEKFREIWYKIALWKFYHYEYL